MIHWLLLEVADRKITELTKEPCLSCMYRSRILTRILHVEKIIQQATEWNWKQHSVSFKWLIMLFV